VGNRIPERVVKREGRDFPGPLACLFPSRLLFRFLFLPGAILHSLCYARMERQVIPVGQYIIPGIFTLLVAIIEAVAARERRDIRSENAKADTRAALRAEESRLSMQMMSATLQLSVVTANALTGGHNNGNVERAKSSAEEAMNEYSAFINKVASKVVSK